MTADPVSRLFELQIRHISFVAQIPHLEYLKQNDTSFNRTSVKNSILQKEHYEKQFNTALKLLAPIYSMVSRIAVKRGVAFGMPPHDEIFVAKDTQVEINPPNYIIYNPCSEISIPFCGVCCETIIESVGLSFDD